MSGNKSGPYTTKEKLLLAQLIKDNNVVENKKTDGASVAEKQKAWELIAIIFNSQPEVNVTWMQSQLQKLWNNFKKR